MLNNYDKKRKRDVNYIAILTFFIIGFVLAVYGIMDGTITMQNYKCEKIIPRE